MAFRLGARDSSGCHSRRPEISQSFYVNETDGEPVGGKFTVFLDTRVCIKKHTLRPCEVCVKSGVRETQIIKNKCLPR